MKLMTFNTQHCQSFREGRIDFSLMADAIRRCGADIVGLNEMRGWGVLPGFDAQAAILAGKTGLRHYYFAKAIGVKGWNPYGNGILSRCPIVRAQTVPIPDPAARAYDGYYETRCLLKAELKNGVTVLVTHFGLNPDEQENAAKTVAAHLKSRKCILMGDFNVPPEAEVLTGIRERMKDAAELFRAPLCSFPSDRPETKIDYIFVSPDIEVLEADIPEIVASDHRPHTATVRITGI